MPKRIILILAALASLQAQMRIPGPGGVLASTVQEANYVADAGLVALISHPTTAGITTTGASLLFAQYAISAPITGCTISDANGNAWHVLSDLVDSGGYQSRAWYAYDHGGTPLVVGAAHTVSVSGCSAGGGYPSILQFAAFSGTLTSGDPFDAETANSGDIPYSIQPGSLTPGQNGSLLVTCFHGIYLHVPSTAVDSGFAKLTVLEQGGYMGGAIGWRAQATAAAINPTWSSSEVYRLSTRVVAFKPGP